MGTINDLIRKLERFQNEIENLSGKTVSIIPDKNGMIDRQCPKEECHAFFKVNAEDWKNIVRDEEVFCPFCRNNSIAQEYFPKEQRTQIVSNIRRSVSDFWNHGHSIAQNIASLQSKEEFQLHIQCEKCNVRFSVIGAAYFCPCCGHSAIERTAKESIEKLILKSERITLIQDTLEQTFSRDEATIITKSLIENSLSDCVGTLQTFSETKYNQLSSIPAPFNAFQNVEKSNKLWILLKGIGYDTWLTADEMQKLQIYTQRRHILEHKGGLVDSKYLQTTNDNIYKEGDRIIVSPNDIQQLGRIVLKIIDNVDRYFEFKNNEALDNIAFFDYNTKLVAEIQGEYDFEEAIQIIKKDKDFSIELNDDEMKAFAHVLFNKGFLTGENSCFGGALHYVDRTNDDK